MLCTCLIKEYRLHAWSFSPSQSRETTRKPQENPRTEQKEADSRRGGGFKAQRREIQGTEEFHRRRRREGRTSRGGLRTLPARLFLDSRRRGGGFKAHRSSIAVGVEKGGQAEEAFAACRRGYSSAAFYVAGTTKIAVFWSPSILPQSI